MIVLVLLEIYDIYIDIAYLIELIGNTNKYPNDKDEYFLLFGIFLTSMIVTILCNFVVVVVFLKHESSFNEQFLIWFQENHGKILLLLTFSAIGDIGLVNSIFTSQIFGLSLFFASLTVKGVSIIHISFTTITCSMLCCIC